MEIRSLNIPCLLTALVTISACQNATDMAFESDKNVILFGTKIETKGVTTVDVTQIKTINVFGSTTTGNKEEYFTVDQPLANTDGKGEKWYFKDEAIAWPVDENYPLKFFAYSPAMSEKSGLSMETIDDKTKITYDTPEDVTDHTDFIYSTREQKMWVPIVPLDFQHALSKVSFAIEGDPDMMITKITLEDIYTKGTMAYNLGGVVDSWTLEQEKKTFTLSINDELSSDVTPGDKPTLVTSESGYLFLLPQNASKKKVLIEIAKKDGSESRVETLEIPKKTKWEAGNAYQYVIRVTSDESSLYDERGESNCYIINPSDTKDQEVLIPISDRINEYWGGGNYENYPENTITPGDTKQWEVMILWYDSDLDPISLTGALTTSKVGLEKIGQDNKEGEMTSFVKVTVPKGFSNEGNVVIAVWKDKNKDGELTRDGEGRLTHDEVLWSWHLWITKYNPDAIAKANTPQDGVYRYELDGFEGSIHRYKDLPPHNTWSNGGIYENSFVMDRNLGAREANFAGQGSGSTVAIPGCLYYQYGRKDPFPGRGAGKIFANTVGLEDKTFLPEKPAKDYEYMINNQRLYFDIPHTIMNPTAFCKRQNFNGSYDVNYIWNDPYCPNPLNGAADPQRKKKSIFDPSPEGWMVPVANIWLDFSGDSQPKDGTCVWADKDGVTFPIANWDRGRIYTDSRAYYACAGFLTENTASYTNTDNHIFMWTSVPTRDYKANSLYMENNGVQNNVWLNMYRGQCIRCIQER